jgi:hypothetical protein
MSAWVWSLLSGKPAGPTESEPSSAFATDDIPDPPLPDRTAVVQTEPSAALADQSEKVISGDSHENLFVIAPDAWMLDFLDDDLSVNLPNAPESDLVEEYQNGEENECLQQLGEESSAIDNLRFITAGTHFGTWENLSEQCRCFAKSQGFTIALNSHPFPKLHPHPLLGADSKAIQRGKLYCSFKDAGCKTEQRIIRSTCTWFVQFTFDRNSLDYYITKSCLEHNHEIQSTKEVVAGGLLLVNLSSELLESERSMINQLSRYNLPTFKVMCTRLTKCPNFQCLI